VSRTSGFFRISQLATRTLIANADQLSAFNFELSAFGFERPRLRPTKQKARQTALPGFQR